MSEHEQIKAALAELAAIDAETVKLGQISSLLHWDLETQIPSGGVPQRAEQLSYLSGLIHDTATQPRIGELLDILTFGGIPVDSLEDLDWRRVRAAKRSYDQDVKLPKAHVEEESRVTSLANHAWAEARANNDFASYAPHLEKIVELNRKTAEYLGYADHPYDALLDRFEQGMTVKTLDRVFGEMREKLVALVQRIAAQPQVRTDFLTRSYPADKQEGFSRRIAAELGYDFSRGYLTTSAHPFTIDLSSDDVRITTRYEENYLPTALFGTIHEAGHALYELGFADEIKNTGVAGGTSLGIHESQSRFWENLVGRSRAFWQRYYGDLQEVFPEQLADVELEEFYRGINNVQPSLIRVEADEVTYGLHVILRYEIEKQLVTGDLAVQDLPAAWNSRMQEFLGIVPSDDRDGVLQDVHWSHGAIGYFPTYALGNLYGAQFTAAMEAKLGSLDPLIRGGEFTRILDWLRGSIHVHGLCKTPAELLHDITGQELQAQPFVDYLQQKYGEIYGL
ncbi:carboxypeptidase M32 [Spirochaeta africana]|uniref:Metal-dependent carboxypeptidase n=1 Tax=Spirochaeta africana (strain ATCC 700263 / DSM 8902 / Z-7692) TaxID=889378 RepID=H9UM84_SPIAZ|nr:carboxypeptidase M32 [Spirochaeta africana]AFG38627.1 Zn-dependent carboxypeptidase [Spirochaeta africana DSM 8902]